MRSFVLMRPEGIAEPAPEDWRLLPDGFSRMAFLFPGPWLILHGLWAWGVIALVLPWVVAGFLPADDGTKGVAFLLVSLAVAVIAGLEGRGRVIERLARKGHRTVGVIEARTREEAEDKLAMAATWTPALGRSAEAATAIAPGGAAGAVSRPSWRHPGYRRPVVADAEPSRASLMPLGGR